MHIQLGLALLAGALAAMAADDGVILVNKGSDSAGIYNARTGQTLATISVGKKPHELVLSEDRRTAYVTNYGVDTYTDLDPGDNTISIIDLVARNKTADISLGKYRRPHGIERGKSGRLYVTTDFPAAVLVIDPKERKVVREFPLEETLPHMLAVTRDEKTAVVACAGSASIAVLSLETGRSSPIDIGGTPMGVILNTADKRAYATNRNGESISAIDIERAVLITKILLPGDPVRLQYNPDRTKIVVTFIGAGDAAVIDTLTMKPEYRFPAGKAAEGLTFDDKGKYLYITAQGEDKLLKFTTTDWRLVLQVPTGAKPDTPAIFPLK